MKHYTVLGSVFADAYRIDEVVSHNPMDKVTRPTPRKDDKIKEIQTYSVDEARYILDCLDKEPLQWQVIIRLMLDTGARRAEIAGLRWKNVDFRENTIKIEHNLQYTPAKGVYNTTPKGKKKRPVYIDPETMELMRELKASQTVKTLEDYCFTNGQGQPLHPQTPTRYMKSFGKRYGIPHLHPHKLRHTAASIEALVTGDYSSISEKLGHANKSTTLDMYIESNPEARKKANEAYRKALYKETKKRLCKRKSCEFRVACGGFLVVFRGVKHRQAKGKTSRSSRFMA